MRAGHVGGQAPDRSVAGMHGPLLGRGHVTALHPQPVEPRARQGVVVVAGHERHAPVGRDLAEALEERAGKLDQVRHAAFAQLEQVPEQHHVVGPGHGLDQALAHLGQPGHVRPAQETEVEVGDQGDVHGRDGVSPTSVSGVSRFCRHNRLAVECPICSKDAVPDPAPRAARGPRTSSTGSPRRAATVSSSRGPYAAAGPYAGGIEVRLERVPGGLRLAEWQAGQIARKAPELDAPTFPGCWPRPRTRGSWRPPRRGATARPPRAAMAPARAVPGTCARSCAWSAWAPAASASRAGCSGPNAGWQLQEAPVMLPAARFREAIESAAEQGVLHPQPIPSALPARRIDELQLDRSRHSRPERSHGDRDGSQQRAGAEHRA